MKNKNSYIKFSNVLFIIYIATLIGCSLFFYNRVKILDRSFDRVSHSIRIKQKIRQVEAEVSISESAQRGYLLTQDSIFLQHFTTAQTNAMRALDTIAKLTTDNPKQMVNTKELRELTSLRFTLLKEILESKDFLATDTGERKSKLLNGKMIMDSLLNLTDTMNRIENDLLKDRRKVRDEARDLTPKYVFAILLFSVLVVTICYFALMRRFR